MDASELLDGIRLMPVVVLHDVHHAVPLAITLRDAGIRAMEITLRTDAAMDALQRVARDVPGIIPGVGSVRRPEQFAEVQRAGARFAVSPGSTPALRKAAQDASLPYLPGAATASEMLTLLEQGYCLQKFFPAELLGGVPMLKAISAPLPELRFCPTGGLNADLAPDYLALSAVSCIGGSWFIPGDALKRMDFASIGALAEAAVNACAAADTGNPSA